MKRSDEVLAKIKEFKENTENTDKLMAEIKKHISYFEKRAKN